MERPFQLNRVEYKPTLVSDSKSGNLKRELIDLLKNRANFHFRFDFICRGRMTFRQKFYDLERQNRYITTEKCVFFVFLGTCDLTVKKDRFIQLVIEDESSVHNVFRYIDKFNQLINSYGCRVVFFLGSTLFYCKVEYL